MTKPVKQEVLLQAIVENSMAVPSTANAPTLAIVAIPLLPASKFARHVPAYLHNCRQNIAAMLEALEKIDFAALIVLGHNMRGSGGAFGFQAITDFSGALQLAAENADIDASRAMVGQLSSFIASAGNGAKLNLHQPMQFRQRD